MKVLKLEKSLYLNGETGILATADTEMPSNVTIDSLMGKVEAILANKGTFLGEGLNIGDALTANRKHMHCELPFDDKSIVQASDWLKLHQNEPIVLGIHSVYVNFSTKTWFINYWTIPRGCDMLTRQ